MIELSKYNTIESIKTGIASVEIQGATNVALAVLHGMELESSSGKGIEDIIAIGNELANSRLNEPLARSAVMYVKRKYEEKRDSFIQSGSVNNAVSQIISDFFNMLVENKRKIVQNSTEIGKNINCTFTHCHSSTVENILINYSKQNTGFSVFCTETRPLMQGRITAKNLVDNGVDTTLIIDSASEGVIAGTAGKKVDICFIGADEITTDGSFVNKVGSYGICLSASIHKIPVYVVSSILKVNPKTGFKEITIEQRDSKEVWDNPPTGLKIYNPSFEEVPAELITGYITEVGVLKPSEISKALHDNYDFVF